MTRPSGRALATAAGIAVATALVVVSLRSIDWGAALTVARRASWAWLAAAIAVNGAIIAVWTTQWRLLLGPAAVLPWRRVFDVVAITAMISNTTPYMAGQASGVMLVARRGGVGEPAALSLLAMEQFAEGFAKLALVAFVAWVVPLPPWVASSVAALALGVAVLLGVVVLGGRSWGDPSTSNRFVRFAASWTGHVRAMRRVDTLVPALVLALSMKILEAAAIVAVQRALGVSFSLGTVALVLISVNLATMVALAPGNLGVYEAAAFAAYRYAGAAPELALALAIVHHLVYLIPMVVTGYVVMWLSGRRLWQPAAQGINAADEPPPPAP